MQAPLRGDVSFATHAPRPDLGDDGYGHEIVRDHDAAHAHETALASPASASSHHHRFLLEHSAVAEHFAGAAHGQHRVLSPSGLRSFVYNSHDRHICLRMLCKDRCGPSAYVVGQAGFYIFRAGDIQAFLWIGDSP